MEMEMKRWFGLAFTRCVCVCFARGALSLEVMCGLVILQGME